MDTNLQKAIVPSQWVDFFTLLMLKQGLYEWAKDFLTSDAWSLLQSHFGDDISYSFTLPSHKPTVVITDIFCSSLESLIEAEDTTTQATSDNLDDDQHEVPGEDLSTPPPAPKISKTPPKGKRGNNNLSWVLTNIYAPCTYQGKRDFVHWFKHIQMPDYIDWIVIGDFNLYCSPNDRNRDGPDLAKIYFFNDAVSALGLIELPLKGKCLWTNKQHPPLLERLDWFFTSACCAFSLTAETSDHVPCLISISTAIPKTHIFRFENYWLQHDGFLSQVQEGWQTNLQIVGDSKI